MASRQLMTSTRLATKHRDHTAPKVRLRRLYLSLAVANTGGFLVGIHLVLFSGILEMPHFARMLGTRSVGFFPIATITPMTKSVITSSLIIGMTLTSPLAGVLIDRIGRRPSLLLMAMLFTVSSATTMYATTVFNLMASRTLAGAAYAIATIAIPLYAAEIAPLQHRGAFVNVYQVFTALGMLFAQLCNLRFSREMWTMPVSLSLAPALVALLSIALGVPESPVWLATRQRTNKVLLPLRMEQTEGVERVTHDRSASSLRDIMKDAASRHRLLIGAGLAMAQQLCGINAIFFYSPAIIKEMLQWTGNDASLKAAAAVGFANLVATILAIFVINLSGRRTLLLGGAPIMFVCLLVIGAMRNELVPKQPVIGVGALLMYVMTFSLTYGPVSFVIASEIFPPRCSGICMSVCIGVMGFCSAVVGLTFLPLMDAIGGAVFFIFAFFLVLSTAFVWYMVPETKDLSLQQIEQLLDIVHR